MLAAPWYLAALAAAIVWGIHYPLVDHALKKLSLPGVLLLTAAPILLLALVTPRQLQNDFAVIQGAAWSERALLLAPALTSLLASVFLFTAIGAKNATLASLIEISYPAFVALFAWLLFKEIHLTPSALLGGALIMSGVVLITRSNA